MNDKEQHLFQNSIPLEDLPEEEVVDLAGYQVTKAELFAPRTGNYNMGEPAEIQYGVPPAIPGNHAYTVLNQPHRKTDDHPSVHTGYARLPALDKRRWCKGDQDAGHHV